MRGYLQDKLNDDHLSSVKQKEKSTVLFNEVVKLGEKNEKHQEIIQNLSINYESRIQTLEARLASAEQNTNTTEKKGDASSTFLNEVIERLESKVQNMESNFHFMSNEQKKEKDSMSRLELTSLRYNEDFKNIISSVQTDFQGKLEIKMTDLISKLLME